MSDQGQKTEQPTHRRLDKARREGRFPVSRDFVGAVHFLAFVWLLVHFTPACLGGARKLMRNLIAAAYGDTLTPLAVTRILRDILFPAILPLLLTGAALTMLSFGAHVSLTRLGMALSRLSPDFSRLNPVRRLKDLPRQNVPALLQALILLPLFGAIVYAIAADNVNTFLSLPLLNAESGVARVGASIRELLWKAAGALFVLGCVDLFRQRRRYLNDLRMTKQEVREEMKEVEGNPHTKMRIRRLQRDLLRRQMMKEVPKATAVVVNPTHYAVAIRYRLEAMAAPMVVAKGKNYLALRIRQKAIENQVPIIENPPLAQALYKSVEVGQEIPAHLYRAVAEILAYIYRLMNGRLPG